MLRTELVAWIGPAAIPPDRGTARTSGTLQICATLASLADVSVRASALPALPHSDSMRQDETWYRLKDWTYGQTPSERLAAHVLLAEGYTDLDPSHPLGGRDGGADAIARRDGKRWVMAVYFPRGQQSLSAITDKFTGDLNGVAKNGADGMVFVTNQELTRGERTQLAESAAVPVELYHLERLALLLDQPKLHPVREQYLFIPPAIATGLDAAARLEEMRRASIARCLERWLAVGLDREQALELADDLAIGLPPEHLLPGDANPVVVWTGVMGSGKSIAVERTHQSDLRAFAEGTDRPIPVFLKAREALPGLSEAAVAACSEIGDPRRVGARIIVDGLDEAGQDAAAELLAQARVLTGTWPKTTVVLSSRSSQVLSEATEHRDIPALSPDDQARCIAIGAGGDVSAARLHGLPEAVRSTLRYPLFALLTGVWIRQRQEDPRAPVDLMRMLGERAARELSADQQQLRDLAAKSIARELGAVPPAELRGDQIPALLGTGMVVERPGGLVFGLPALAQWFAAQALQLGEITATELLRAPEDLELWRDPLGLALAAGSSTQTTPLLRELFAGEPGFAFRVIDVAVGQAVVSGITPPPWRDGAQQAREALQTIADGLGPLAPFVANAGADGRVLPMAAASDAHHLTIAFFRDPSRPEISPMPGGLVGPGLAPPGAVRIRGAQIGDGPAWTWRWALSGVRHDVDAMLKRRSLPIASAGPLADEEAWATALDLLQESPLLCSVLPLSDVLNAVENLTTQTDSDTVAILTMPGRRRHDLTALRRYLLGLREFGETELRSPLPTADKREGGWVGDFYTDGRLLEFAQVLYERVVAAYVALVERWMPTLAPRLEHYALLPARIHGFIGNGPGGIGRIPQMGGYLEPLPPGSDSVIDVRFGGLDFAIGEAVYAQQRAARPLAARWITGTLGGLPFDVGERYAVSDAVYSWLTHDLQQLKLASYGAKPANRDSLAIWESNEPCVAVPPPA